MPASKEERRHMAAIAGAKAAERRERIREALARPAVARMIDGLELGHAMPSSPEREAILDERALGQAELQARATARAPRLTRWPLISLPSSSRPGLPSARPASRAR